HAARSQFFIMELLYLGFILLLVSKSLTGVTITQKPALLGVTQGKEATLNCEHDDGSYYYMYWYKQRSSGEMLSLLAISFGKDTEETVAPFNKTKFKMTRPEIKESSLKIEGLLKEDSGVYFCASSIAQYYNSVKQLNNNLNLSNNDHEKNNKAS
ncbi:hypothetical protein IRJ41_019305, partial [Triplophysa rosa]